MNVLRPTGRVSVFPEMSPDDTGSDRGTDAVSVYPERDSNPHGREGHKILSRVSAVSASVHTSPYRGENGSAVDPHEAESVPNGDRSFPEMSPEFYRDWADDLSRRCDELSAYEEQLRLRISALRERLRELALAVGPAERQANPEVLAVAGVRPFYVYALVSSGAPTQRRYIGCTTDPEDRLHAHLGTKGAAAVKAWAVEVMQSGHVVQMVRLWSGSSQEEAYATEERLIREYADKGMADLNIHGNSRAYSHTRARRRGL